MTSCAKLLKVKKNTAPDIEEAVSYRTPLAVTQYVMLGRDGMFPVCPRCDSSLEREYVAYCDRCGQRLKANEKIAEAVTEGYKKIEKSVVDGYKKIEKGVVGGYTKIEDEFVDAYLTKDGETVEEAKARLKKSK